MATLNEVTQVANSDETDMGPNVDEGQWSSVFGAPAVQDNWESQPGYGYDPGPGFDVGGGLQADPKESQRSANPYSTPTGINWGQGNAVIGGSSGGGGGSNVAWATPFAKAAQQSGATGGGITRGTGTVKPPYATLQESTFAPKKGTVAPTFAPPAFNQGEVKSRARKMAAPGLSQLNMKVQSAMSRYYENPNVRRMVLRDTLAGYGIGVSNIMAKAQQSAQSEYGAEHERLYGEAMSNYNVLMAQYIQQGNRVTATRPVATEAAYEEAMKNKMA